MLKKSLLDQIIRMIESLCGQSRDLELVPNLRADACDHHHNPTQRLPVSDEYKDESMSHPL